MLRWGVRLANKCIYAHSPFTVRQTRRICICGALAYIFPPHIISATRRAHFTALVSPRICARPPSYRPLAAQCITFIRVYTQIVRCPFNSLYYECRCCARRIIIIIIISHWPEWYILPIMSCGASHKQLICTYININVFHKSQTRPRACTFAKCNSPLDLRFASETRDIWVYDVHRLFGMCACKFIWFHRINAC